MEVNFVIDYFTHGYDSNNNYGEITGPVEFGAIPDNTKFRIVNSLRTMMMCDFPSEVADSGGEVECWIPNFQVYCDDNNQFAVSFEVHLIGETYDNFVGYVLTVINDCVFDEVTNEVLHWSEETNNGFIARLID